MGDEEDEVSVGYADHEIYGREIPGEADMDAYVDMTRPDEDAVKELDEMKKCLKETEEDAVALREMQAKVEKEMGAGQDIRESMEQLRVLETTPLPSTAIEEKDDSLDVWCEDDVSDDAFINSSLLNQEWNRRHEHFHTAGYREGITAGKEASAQAGFNLGFKQSVQVGFNWGLVRGVTSAFTSLSDELKEKLAVTLENKDRLQNLYDSAQTISTTDALKMYHDSIQNTETRQLHSEKSSQTEDTCCSQLDGFYNEIISLLHNSQEIKITMKSSQEMLR